MNSATAFKSSSLSLLGGLSLVMLLLSGCVSSPSRTESGGAAGAIHFVENRSVDLSVREDFKAAMSLLHEERYEAGIELLQKVIKGSHNNSAPYINMAIAYGKLGKDSEAEESLKQALAINPEHPVAMNEYALLYRRTGRFDEARVLYEKLLSEYPEFMPARKNLGILCDLYLNDAPCAMEQYTVYSKAYPNDEDVKIWISGLDKKLGK